MWCKKKCCIEDFRKPFKNSWCGPSLPAPDSAYPGMGRPWFGRGLAAILGHEDCSAWWGYSWRISREEPGFLKTVELPQQPCNAFSELPLYETGVNCCSVWATILFCHLHMNQTITHVGTALKITIFLFWVSSFSCGVIKQATYHFSLIFLTYKGLIALCFLITLLEKMNERELYADFLMDKTVYWEVLIHLLILISSTKCLGEWFLS